MRRQDIREKPFWTLKDQRRFISKIKRGDGCWLWQAGCNTDGYGTFSVGNIRAMRAHRAAFELWIGSIPSGMCVCHTCDNPPCCNPDHLFLGTVAENMADKAVKGRLKLGSRAGTSRLTENDVAEIRVLCATFSQREVAYRYGVSETTISNIITRKHWKHVA